MSAASATSSASVRPSAYLGSIERNHAMPAARLDAILRTHLIDPALMRADQFQGFIRARAGRLLDLIEDAMGKPVAGRDSDKVVETFGGSLARAQA